MGPFGPGPTSLVTGKVHLGLWTSREVTRFRRSLPSEQVGGRRWRKRTFAGNIQKCPWHDGLSSGGGAAMYSRYPWSLFGAAARLVRSAQMSTHNAARKT